jgi:hypothetical protein
MDRAESEKSLRIKKWGRDLWYEPEKKIQPGTGIPQ